MIEGAWSRFLGYAAHARTKPTFEVEERQPKLETAAQLRRSLEAARDRGEWESLLREALRLPSRHPFESARYNLSPPRPRRQLNEWAQRDPQSLRPVLAVFLDAGLDPVDRFARFTEAAEEAGMDSASTLIVGSLLGFSAAPETLPIVRAVFGQLQELLGLDPPDDRPIVEQYAAQLDFARDVRARMEADSIPILDMIDVQSLITIGVREQALWVKDAPAGAAAKSDRAVPRGGVYLAACAVYLNEAPYLREWIEFHRLVGVEHFFLYDNGSTDDHFDVLGPYIDEGVVTLRQWRASPLDQREVFDDCVRSHRGDARWIAFIDVDEFLFSPTGASIAEQMRDYEQWPAVGVNWAMFSYSGNRAPGESLVVERFRLRDRAESGLVKSIVDPLRTVRCESAHWFTYDFGLPVDENQWPIAEGQTKSTSFERLRINHYASRSEAEARAKSERRNESLGWSGVRQWRLRDLAGALELVDDDSIMRWVPALKAALGRTAATR